MQVAAYKFRKENEPPTSVSMFHDPSLNPVPRLNQKLNNEIKNRKSLEITHYSTSGKVRSVLVVPMDDLHSPVVVLKDIFNQIARNVRNNAIKTAPKTTTRKRKRYSSDDDDRSDCRESNRNPAKKSKTNNKRRPNKFTRRDNNIEDDEQSDCLKYNSKHSKKIKGNDKRHTTQTKRRNHNSKDDDKSDFRESKSARPKKTTAKNNRRPTQTKHRNHNSDDDDESVYSAYSRKSKCKRPKTKGKSKRSTTQDDVFEYFKKLQQIEYVKKLDRIERWRLGGDSSFWFPQRARAEYIDKKIRFTGHQLASFVSKEHDQMV